VNWFRRCAFGSHLGEWLALALVILLTFALRVAFLRLVFRVPKRERDQDESERDYWRIHGG
jgi:predicted branched-subunit amino acid permease